MTNTSTARRRTPAPLRPILVMLGLMAGVDGIAASPAAQAPAATAAGQPSRTIQVLTDVPTTEMIPTMRVISASLGVECEFCHETNRTLNTEKKDVARRMMRMTLALNKASFGDSLRVTCFTCHRGSSTPLATATPTGQYTALGVGVLLKGNGS